MYILGLGWLVVGFVYWGRRNRNRGFGLVFVPAFVFFFFPKEIEYAMCLNKLGICW